MEIWLDTANVELVVQANQLGFLEGVTTNPTILSEAQSHPNDIIQHLLYHQKGWVAVQVFATDYRGMYDQAKALALVSDRILVKIPVTYDGLQIIHELHKEGIPSLATAIFTPQQAFLAFKAGAAYIAPYLGRIADTGKSPTQILSLMHAMKLRYKFPGKIMAAGIRNVDIVMACIDIGICAATLSGQVFTEFIQNQEGTLRALEKFACDWSQSVFSRFTGCGSKFVFESRSV